MDYQHGIFKVTVLEHAHTANGIFVPEIIETEPIKGHWEDVTFEMISRTPQAIYNVGDRRLYTETSMSPRDRVIIEELDGEQSHWEVHARPQKLPYWAKLGVVRYTYHLVRLQQNAGTPPPSMVTDEQKTSATTGVCIDTSKPVVDIDPKSTEPEVMKPVWQPSWKKK